MASGNTTTSIESDVGPSCASSAKKKQAVIPECPVCLQMCSHPVQLPCSHIFCFLCIKGVANQSKRCALCRQEIPVDYLNTPNLVHTDDLWRDLSIQYEGYQWYYEGRNGWWQYDQRTSAEIEDRFVKDEKVFELLIAGFLYVIDLENMIQIRRNEPARRRRMKRDLATIEKKGIAGIKIIPALESEREGAYGEESGSKTPPTRQAIVGDETSTRQAVTSDETSTRQAVISDETATRQAVVGDETSTRQAVLGSNDNKTSSNSSRVVYNNTSQTESVEGSQDLTSLIDNLHIDDGSRSPPGGAVDSNSPPLSHDSRSLSPPGEETGARSVSRRVVSHYYKPRLEEELSDSDNNE